MSFMVISILRSGIHFVRWSVSDTACAILVAIIRRNISVKLF